MLSTLFYYAEKVVEFHPYRTREPWNLGFTKIMDIEASDVVFNNVQRILSKAAGCDPDNHSGYTIRMRGDTGGLIHLRFSDWNASLWLVPTGYLPVKDSIKGSGEISEF